MTDGSDRVKEAFSVLLEADARLVAYEYRMLGHAYVAVREATAETFQHAVFLEVFALHFRNLYEFFFFNRKKSKPDDIRVEDFIGHALQEPRDGKQLREYTNKRLAHLTTERRSIFTSDGRQGVDLDRVLLIIEHAWRELLERLQPDQVGWFTDPQIQELFAPADVPTLEELERPTGDPAADRP